MRRALVLILTLAACSGGLPGGPTAAPTDTPDPTPRVAGSSPPAAASPTPTAPRADPRRARLTARAVARGLGAPTAIIPYTAGMLLVAEQVGRVRLVDGGRVSTFLDLRDRVRSGGERGLLGLAFRDGRLTVSYTDSAGALVVSRFVVPSGARTARTAEQRLVRVPHPRFGNHNGGQIAFGPDGFLHIGTGDGGGGGDPDGNAQNTRSLLGKILRIDVSRSCGGRPYCIPATNPFARASAGREIYLWGLRNPWRFSFDRSNGSLWIADVGQGSREEINRVPRAAPGQNLGWDCREGTLNVASRYASTRCGGPFTGPVFEYRTRESGRCAIIGGSLYRGAQGRNLIGGSYVYGDYCSREIWALARIDGRWVNQLMLRHGANITSFGEDAAGELLLADSSGTISRLTVSARA